MSYGFPNDQWKIHAFKICYFVCFQVERRLQQRCLVFSTYNAIPSGLQAYKRDGTLWTGDVVSTSMKCSWTNSRTKEYVVPIPQALETNRVHQKYTKRPNAIEHMSFLQWLRHVDHSKADLVQYKAGNTLVSVKMVSPFKDQYFPQHLLMNFPQWQTSALSHEREADLPPLIFFFFCSHYKNARLLERRWTCYGLFSDAG